MYYPKCVALQLEFDAVFTHDGCGASVPAGSNLVVGFYFSIDLFRETLRSSLHCKGRLRCFALILPNCQTAAHSYGKFLTLDLEFFADN